MLKIQQLYTFLLAELGDYAQRPTDLRCFAEAGTTLAYPGDENRDFKLSYTGIIIFANCTYNAAQLSHILLAWMQRHQRPWTGDEALAWDAEIISASLADIVFSVQLTERMTVTDDNGTIRITGDQPMSWPAAPSGPFDLRIEHDPSGPHSE